MCVDFVTGALLGNITQYLFGKPGVMSTPAVYQPPEQAKTANFAQQGLLFEKSLKRRRKNVKISPLGLEDDEKQKKQLTGE